MKAYKNLVFDVGSVLIGYRWKEMLMEHGLSEEEAVSYANHIFRNPLWLQFDLEILPFEEVVEKYVKAYPDYEELTEWFFSNAEQMAQARPKLWELVGKLKEKGYKIYILSNYSSVLFRLHTEKATFHQYLDGKVISYMMHKVKPDAEIYRYLFTQYHLKPEESLFFDDHEENVIASKENGMDAVQIMSEEHLIKILEQILEDAS